MRAMVLKELRAPLELEEKPIPLPADDEILVRVSACAVCRTDLHVKDGDLLHPKLPLILGHEIVGKVEATGNQVVFFKTGDRVGITWLGGACGNCTYCKGGQENLCDQVVYTGYQKDGGFAEYTTCRADFAIPLPENGLSDVELAPFLCAGIIGYRSYRKAAPKNSLGLYGFGAAAHILAQLALHEGKKVYAFTRPGDLKTQNFAKELGAIWAGGSDEMPPDLLDASILFAPLGALVPLALKALNKGGRCICGGIHMSPIPSFPYEDLWNEKSLHSVANLTREDARSFFSLISQFPVKTNKKIYKLEEANDALEDLRNGKFQGVAVIQPLPNILHPLG